MIELTPYREVYFQNLHRAFPLPTGRVVFDCQDPLLYRSAIGVTRLIWELHSHTSIEHVAVLASPKIENDGGISWANSTSTDSQSLASVPVTRLGEIGRVFELNSVYGNWTLLGYRGTERPADHVLRTESLDAFEFGFEVDIDIGLRGFGPSAVAGGKPVDAQTSVAPVTPRTTPHPRQWQPNWS